MRGARTGAFERRSALYSRLDHQLRDRTRFFAAAALINAVFARLFSGLPARRALRSFAFLSEVGAGLEIGNLGFARHAARAFPGDELDRAFVQLEQRRLQRYVRAHQAMHPGAWDAVRDELNGLLNDRYRASWLAWCWLGCADVSKVLREVKTRLGADLDFASESHRIQIGITLIELIRRKAPPSASAYEA